MKPFTLILPFLLFCFGCSGIPIAEERTFMVDGNEYFLSITAAPHEGTLLADNQPFFLDIEVEDEQGGRVQHLTYDTRITKGEQEVMRDSRHMMEGAPYKRSVMLEKGEYVLEVSLFSGMREEITSIHTTTLPFTV